MTFATVADLQSRFGVQEVLLLSDRDGSGAPDIGVLEGALADADAEIVSVLAGSVPIDPLAPPRNLVRIACDIARYRLAGSTAPEDVRSRYADAGKFLREVAAGRATLDGGAASPAAAQPPSRAAASAPGHRVFRRGQAGGLT